MGRSPLAVAAAVLLAVVATSAHAILPIQHWQTASGARVYFVENRDLPMLDLSVEFPAGSAHNRAEQAGLASMTNRLLTGGAQGLDEDDIARRMADVGARMSGTFDTDRAGLTLRTLSNRRERDQALEIFARVLSAPTFPPEVLEREKVRVTGALRDADTRPDVIAGRTFYRLIYRDHPYGLRGSGEVETVQKLTREQLSAFHRRHYAARYAVVAMIGDLSRAEAEAVAEAVTRGLPEAQGEAPDIPPVPQLAAGEAHLIPHHALQAHIMVGAPGVGRDDPDYIPLFVGNHVLGGGGFTSRINFEVRQRRGLAYSAYSYFSPLRREGPYVIGMQTQREQAAEALKVTDTVLREFLAKGPTPEEVAASKKNIIGGFPLRIDTNRKIHGYLAMIGFYRLPLTYLEDFVKKVESVTIPEIVDAFRRRIDPDRMVTVAVGAAPGKTGP